jgi:predicted nucleic acid-binding protein
MSDPGAARRPILLDNVVLSNFLLADAMTLLLTTIGVRGRLTHEILDENMAGRRAGHAALADLDAHIAPAGDPSLQLVTLTRDERAHYVELIRSLGRGEASGIAAAAARGWVFASDDRAARAHAARIDLPVTDTIGLLLAAVRDERCGFTEGDEVLARMTAAGFRGPVRSLNGLI